MGTLGMMSFQATRVSDPNCVDLSDADPAFDTGSVAVVPGFLSPEEQALLLQECEPELLAMEYMEEHYDAVIRRYREVAKSRGLWSNEANKVRVKCIAWRRINEANTVCIP